MSATKNTVIDVARYILDRKGAMSAMKLQKLVYYAQAWSLAWDEEPLFEEDIQAWANGPVAPSLFQAHKGQYRVSAEQFEGDPSKFDDDQRETLDAVLQFYGDKNPQWLSDLTHSEGPWKLAREGLSDGERGDRVISKESMLEYYSSL